MIYSFGLVTEDMRSTAIAVVVKAESLSEAESLLDSCFPYETFEFLSNEEEPIFN